MSQNLDVKQVEQRVWRASQQDGLMEVAIGILLVATALEIRVRGLIALWIVVLVSLAPGLEAIRKRITYPRIGYVELVQEEPKKTLRGIGVYTIVVFVAMALAFAIFGDIGDWRLWSRWSPTLCGVLLSGGMIYAAGKSGAARYYVFVVLAVGLGIAFSILFPEPYTNLTLYLLTLGGAFILCGGVTFIRFLHRYPLPTEEAADGAE
jgi:hypothetical protein